jgi:hypothetical protein
VTPTELQLWLRTDVTERADAMAGLIEAGDLRLVQTDYGLRLTRAHEGIVTNYELAGLPALPAGAA